MSTGSTPQRSTILFLHPSAELYGADQALLALASGLDRERWRAVVALPSEGPLAERLRAADIEVEVGPLGIGARSTLAGSGPLRFARELPRAILWTRALVRRRRPALVHVNTLIVLGGALGARLAGARLVWHVHEILEQPRWLARTFALLLQLLAARVVFVSRACAAALTCFDRRLLARSEVVWNGLPPQQARAPRRSRDEVRGELGIAADQTLVLLPGRINSWKGQTLLVEAARRLRDRRPRLRYLIAGDAPPGQPRFERELEVAIARTGTDDIVLRVPFVEAIGELYGAADIVAIPSTRPEPFGLVALEAMRFEKPIVAADHGGLAEIVVDGATGRRFDPGDPSALAAELEELTADDPSPRGEQRLKTMGVRGRARQQERFSIEAHLRAFDRTYSELSGRRRAGGPDVVHVALGKANPERMNGVNQVVHHLAMAQVRAGARVAVWGITPTPFATTVERGYDLRLFGRTRGRFTLVRALREALRSAPASCTFHLHGAFLPEMHAVARILAGRRFIFTPHGSYHAVAMRGNGGAKRLYAHLFERSIARRAHMIQAFTEEEAGASARLLKIEHVRVVANGCEPDPAPARERASGERLVIGYLGRLDTHTKGLDLLFAGAALRIRAGADIELEVAGDGPDRAQLEALARSLEIDRHVVFRGPLFGSNKRRFLESLDALALCSRNEGMPIAALEALATARPLIVTPATGLAEAVCSAGAGVVADPAHAEGVAAAIRTLAQGDPVGLCDAAEGLARASSWDEVAKGVERELYALGASAPAAETRSSDPPRPPFPDLVPDMHPRPSTPAPIDRTQALRSRFEALDAARAGEPKGSGSWFARVARLVQPRRVPPVLYDESGKTFLHVSSGERHIETWINAALSTPGARAERTRRAKPASRARRAKGPRKPDWKIDPTRAINAPDDHFDGVLLSYVIERLTCVENLDLMTEVLRTLRPGSAVRIVTSASGGPVRRSAWTAALVIELLETVGFVDVGEVHRAESSLPGIDFGPDQRDAVSFFVECVKPAEDSVERRLAS